MRSMNPYENLLFRDYTMTEFVTGINILLSIIIIAVTLGLHHYCVKQISNGFKVPFFEETTVVKFLNYWKIFNRVLIGLIILSYFVWAINGYYQSVKNQTTVSNKPVTPVIQKVYIEKATPVKTTLDQEVFFYCLDKASSRKDGVSAEQIKACKEAALNTVNRLTEK